MGKNLLTPLLKELGEVIKIDKNSKPAQWRKAWQADVIWLSLPRQQVNKILKEVSLKKSQLIIDICSIKKGISKEIKKTGAAHLSLHPLQGPFVPLRFQKWIAIGLQHNIIAKRILFFLESKKVKIIKASSEDHHDFMMSLVLCFPEIITLIIMFSLKRLGGQKNKLGLRKLLEWSAPASNFLFEFCVHSVISSPDWLRKEFVFEDNGGLLLSVNKSLKEFVKKSPKQVENLISVQKRQINKQLKSQEKKNISMHVNTGFESSTFKFFNR